MRTLEADEVTAATKKQERRWGIWNVKTIGEESDVYIRRISLITTPWFSIKLHRIYRPDNQRELHDHPWTFLSIVLWGYYDEMVECRHCKAAGKFCHFPPERRVRWWNFKRAEDSHSIRRLSRTPVWTLVLTGPARRAWGFYTERGWVEFDKYDKLNDV